MRPAKVPSQNHLVRWWISIRQRCYQSPRCDCGPLAVAQIHHYLLWREDVNEWMIVTGHTIAINSGNLRDYPHSGARAQGPEEGEVLVGESVGMRRWRALCPQRWRDKVWRLYCTSSHQSLGFHAFASLGSDRGTQ